LKKIKKAEIWKAEMNQGQRKNRKVKLESRKQAARREATTKIG